MRTLVVQIMTKKIRNDTTGRDTECGEYQKINKCDEDKCSDCISNLKQKKKESEEKIQW